MNNPSRREPWTAPEWIPWALIAPHEPQAERNHSQSLLTLNGRGGLSPSEAMCVLEDREWGWGDALKPDENEEGVKLQALVDAFEV